MRIQETAAAFADASRRIILGEPKFPPDLQQAIDNYPQINFAKLLSTSKPRLGKTIINPSGLKLIADIVPEYLIYLKAKDSYEPLCLQARFLGNNLELNLQSGFSADGGKSVLFWHPDMFAKRFIDVAMAHFSQFRPIEVIEGKWNHGERNYTQFHEAIEAGLTETQAAAETWSAKQFAKRGFTELSLVVNKPSLVKFYFRRKPPITSTSPSVASKT